MHELTRSEVEYLEAMYRLNESHNTTSVSALAKRFRVRLPTAIEILDKLEEKGLVIRKPWKVPELSRRGNSLAERLIHQHRIVELYLNRTLGLNSVTSCSEASKVAHLFEKSVIRKMCKSLRRPKQCMHGYLIRHGDD
jgi:DtxR family Mn-dependent transcriptional regulator